MKPKAAYLIAGIALVAAYLIYHRRKQQSAQALAEKAIDDMSEADARSLATVQGGISLNQITRIPVDQLKAILKYRSRQNK